MPAAAAVDCHICFCSEVEVENTGDEFYDKLLRLKADNKRRLALLQDQMNGEVMDPSSVLDNH